MLPPFAELGTTIAEENPAGSVAPIGDAFDEASFGIWSTVMGTLEGGVASESNSAAELSSQSPITVPGGSPSRSDVSDPTKPIMVPHKRDRLEEFAAAFLGMSVFDVADIWIPQEGKSVSSLFHVASVTSTHSNEALNHFIIASQETKIEPWSGAVGRAYASGNPVWSANQEVIVDSYRATAFYRSKIQTALAVPIFSVGHSTPVCVLCSYSLRRTDAVPFVLRFVQQALRLLWGGLEGITPHQSVDTHIWKGVAPADLGQMAADLEMQQEFIRKKRPHDSISRVSAIRDD